MLEFKIDILLGNCKKNKIKVFLFVKAFFIKKKLTKLIVSKIVF